MKKEETGQVNYGIILQDYLYKIIVINQGLFIALFLLLFYLFNFFFHRMKKEESEQINHWIILQVCIKLL